MSLKPGAFCYYSLLPGLYLLVVIIVTLIVYWPGLSGPLLLDDAPNLHHLQKYGEGVINWKEVFLLSSHGTSRPLSILSFLINWDLSGADTWFLKFTNLLIHILCGLVIYRLTSLLLGFEIFKKKDLAQKVALWTTALWLLSPFLLSTVLYVIQRMAQLSALFTLCGLLFYVRGRINFARHIKPGLSMMLASIIFFWPLATLSKQNGILLPLLILVVEFFFFYRDSGTLQVRQLRRLLVALSCLPLVLVVYWVIYDANSLIGNYSERNFTLYERLITQPRILIDYIANLLLLPGTSAMSLFHDDFIKSSSLVEPITTLPCIIFFCAVLISAFLNIGKKAGVVLFGIVFFLSAHLVESTFIPLELYFEHRNYLPAFGIYFSISTALAFALQKIKFKCVAIIVLLIVPLTFSIYTYQRAVKWQKLTSIYYLSEITHPDSPRLNEGLAFLYLLINDSESALFHLDKVTAMDNRQRTPEFYFKYLAAYCKGKKSISDEDFILKLNIDSLSNDLSTVNYFERFVTDVEANKCNTLDLNKIADKFLLATANRNREFDLGHTSYVNMLLARLLVHLGRSEEAFEQVKLGSLTR